MNTLVSFSVLGQLVRRREGHSACWSRKWSYVFARWHPYCHHLTHGSHFNQFIHFRRAHSHDQHADRCTNHATSRPVSEQPMQCWKCGIKSGKCPPVGISGEAVQLLLLLVKWRWRMTRVNLMTDDTLRLRDVVQMTFSTQPRVCTQTTSYITCTRTHHFMSGITRGKPVPKR